MRAITFDNPDQWPTALGQRSVAFVLDETMLIFVRRTKGKQMTHVLHTKDGAVAYLQQGLKELRDIAIANNFEMLAYIIEMAQSEARNAGPALERTERGHRSRDAQ